MSTWILIVTLFTNSHTIPSGFFTERFDTKSQCIVAGDHVVKQASPAIIYNNTDYLYKCIEILREQK